MPTLSVVIPTYNRAELLRRAIASVLAQVDAHFEVIVSDNASDDHTRNVVATFASDPRLIYARNATNVGMVGNWRRAIFDLARGDWFMLMSDDDHLIDPTYLREALRAIEIHRPRFVYAGAHIEDQLSGALQTLRLPFKGLVSGAAVFASRGTVKPQDMVLANMLFPRADARRLGFLSDPDNVSCDSELALKLCCEGPVFAVPTAACVYVKHGANLVSRINSTRRLLDHNIDHLVNPLAYARQMDMAPASLAAFRTNTGLDRYIAFTLLKLRLHDENWYLNCRDRIAARLPDVVAEVEASMDYRLKYALIAAGRPWLRRRYPLLDSGTGAH